MFGGIGFLLHGNLALAVWHEFLIVRVGAERYEQALARHFVQPFDLTGRPMTGWVMVEPDGLDVERDLREWVEAVESHLQLRSPPSKTFRQKLSGRRYDGPVAKGRRPYARHSVVA